MALSTVTAYVAPESTFGVDPDSDGSDYLAMQVRGKPMVQNERKLEPSNYAVGREREQVYLVGQDGASIPLDILATPLATLATDGLSPPAIDGLDAVISAALGAPATVAGEGLAAGGNTTTVVLDSDLVDVEDLLCVSQSASRSEWRPVTVDVGAGTYTVAPSLASSPDATRDAYGYRYWRDTDTQGASISLYSQLGGNGYRLSGARPSLKLSMQAGADSVIVSAAFKADSKTRETKASLPAISGFSVTPIKPVLSPVFWGSTEIVTKSVEIDWQASPVDIGATSGTNGRADIANLTKFPVITIEPGFSTDLEDDMVAGTVRTLLIQVGAGGGRGSMCFYARAAQITAIAPTDDGNYLRQKVTLRVVDPGIRTGTTPYRYWTLARS